MTESASSKSAIDWKSLSDEEFEETLQAAFVEQSRRAILANAEREISELKTQYEKALGRSSGGEWVQPTGAHDTYDKDAVVTFNGHLRRSLIDNNFTQPSDDKFWVYAKESDTAPAPEAPPWNSGEALKVGDLRLYKGVVYSVIQAHTSAAHWPPDQVPALYRRES